MKKYKLWFELYGKKLCTTIVADNEAQAKRLIADKIIFHKVELQNMSKDEEEMLDMFKGIFNMK